MATTANKNCKQFTGVVLEEITAREGNVPGKGKVTLKTVLYNEDEDENRIEESGSTEIEVFNRSTSTFAENEEVDIWQDGYGVYWVTLTKDNRDFFVISSSDNVAQYAKKGGVFQIQRGVYGIDSTPCWVVKSTRVTDSYRVAICQEDMPDDYFDNSLNLYYLMPYYTPEMNYGERPNFGSSAGGWNSAVTKHIGIVEGEHSFSNKRLDYTFKNGRFAYTPQFLFSGAAINNNGSVGISIEGHTYNVQFPPYSSINSTSLTSYPDVYAGDIITVLVEDSGDSAYSANVYAVNYPTDFMKGSTIATDDSYMFSGYRGWTDTSAQGTPPPAGILFFTKDQGLGNII